MSIKVMNFVFDHMNDIQGTALVIMLALADWCDEDGVCFPSVETIAKKAHVKVRYARKVLKELRESGEIGRASQSKKNQNGQYTNRWYLNKYRESIGLLPVTEGVSNDASLEDQGMHYSVPEGVSNRTAKPSGYQSIKDTPPAKNADGDKNSKPEKPTTSSTVEDSSSAGNTHSVPSAPLSPAKRRQQLVAVAVFDIPVEGIEDWSAWKDKDNKPVPVSRVTKVDKFYHEQMKVVGVEDHLKPETFWEFVKWHRKARTGMSFPRDVAKIHKAILDWHKATGDVKPAVDDFSDYLEADETYELPDGNDNT